MKYIFTVDIGGTEIKYGVIDSSSNLIYKDKMPSKGSIGGKFILDDVIEKFNLLSKKYSFLGISVSSGGVINSKTGEVLSATGSIKDYVGVNIINYLNEKLNVPVSVLNDVNSMALCESFYGAGKNLDSMIALTIGTGIGGAIIINGNLVEGSAYSAGEFGLMKIESEIYEEIASTSSLVKFAKREIPSINNGLDVFKYYDEGHQDIIKVVNKFYDNLAIGIANLIYAFNPSAVIIGGGISGREKFIDELNEHLRNKLSSYMISHTKIKAAKFKNDAGMIGAYVHFLKQYPDVFPSL
ncbi:MAG: ROK family protein [Acholeplasmataceae bacterium]|jgi:predicted NBD/HSP70 family sugar kinase